MMIDVPDSEGYRFIVGPTDQLHLKKLYLYQLEKDLCPKKRALSTENQKALLINGGNFINVLFWSSAPRSFFRLLSRFQKVNKLKFGAQKRMEHFIARKRVLQIQHGYLDSTLYLGHWEWENGGWL